MKMKDEFICTNRFGKLHQMTIHQSLTKPATRFHKFPRVVTYSADMDDSREKHLPALPEGAPVAQALSALLRNPWQHVVLRWNSKAAVLSAFFRGVIFLIASVKSHHAGRASGVFAEALFGAVSAGFFGALTQSLRFAQPEWLAALLLAGVFPLAFQLGDFTFHAALGTQVFLIGMISSAVFTVLSSGFNLYIMRRGTLLVGEEGNPFSQDLSALPRLALMFVVAGVMKTWRFIEYFLRQDEAVSDSVSADNIASS
jgi:hypothetical protein